MMGGAEMVAKIRAIAAQFPDRVAAALYTEAQIEMTEAKRRTPVWNPAVKAPPGIVKGALRASGKVSTPVRNGKNISVTLSFGGGAVTYAVYVHENPDAFHAIGQWQFLKSVLDESAPYMAARIGARLQL